MSDMTGSANIRAARMKNKDLAEIEQWRLDY